MILQSLTAQYEALNRKGKVPDYGYAFGNTAFLMSIDEAGKLHYITPLTEQVQRGRNTATVNQVRSIPLPYVRSSGVRPHFLCDTSAYLLGMASNGANARIVECFEQSKAFHQEVLGNCNSKAAQALLNFFSSWTRDAQHQAIVDCVDVLSGGFIIIELLNHGLIHEDEQVKQSWISHLNTNQSQAKGACLVTGEVAPVSMLHQKIKRVYGAQSSGASFVSFNATSTESFEKANGLISPVSEYAAFAYTTALNYLLTENENHCQIGGDTMVYWVSGDQEEASQMLNSFLHPPNQRENQDKLAGLMRRISKALPVNDLPLDTPCFVLGIAPNAARLSVRYFLRNTLGGFAKNLAAHYERLDIIKPPSAPDYLTPYLLLQQTVNPNTRDKAASPLLGGAVMRAILNNTPYPQALYQAVLLRTRATQDNKDKGIYKITWSRMAIIKACLLKMDLPMQNREVLSKMLNPDSNNKAYVLGRLFSVLEEVQQAANPTINTTIKDRYFNAASSTPLLVYPNILRLSNHHLNKIDYPGIKIRLQKSIGELMNKLEVDNNPYPANLSIIDQGIFMLGYYHQDQYRYTKKEDR